MFNLFKKEIWPGEKVYRKEYNRLLEKVFHFSCHDFIEGDYLEFGVFQGASLKESLKCAKKFGFKGRLFGFDSFQGMPKSSTDNVYFMEGNLNCPIEHVQKQFSPQDINNKVFFIKGFYRDTLNQELKQKYQISKAAIINFDCDVYESTISSLSFCTSLVQIGTVFNFDDWFCHKADPEKGVQQAFYEWKEKNKFEFSDYATYGTHSKTIICTRAS